MKRLVVFVSLLCALLAPAAIATAAYNPLGTACQSGGKASASSACDKSANNGSDPIGGPNGAVKKASMIVAVLAGIAAVLIIIIAGLELVTSGGDSQKVANARSTIIGAVIGLVIIVAAESIIVFVVSRV